MILRCVRDVSYRPVRLRPAFRAQTRCISAIAPDSKFFKISGEVRDALHARKPIVALETTIYTHGYPYPQNIALASELESIVRVNGGVPATIGIIDGVAKVGLTPEELIELAASAGKETTLKLSRRDLSYVLGTRLTGKRFNGGTTIAGTMILAHLAGIKVFATGGLGGVHRGAESSMDISADLTELGRTPVAVISAGCKSFLDIPRTLEYLETEGVTVGTFADGREGKVDFPAFWSRESGVRSPLTIQDEKEAAAIIHAHLSLPLHSGLHFANPVPEEASVPKEDMDVFIEEAIRQAAVAGASGKDNTPFILSKIKELSDGKSINANRALICANVQRGTIVARELVALEKEAEGRKELLSIFMQPDQQSSMTTSSVQSTPSESASTTSISVSTSSDDAGQYFQPFSGPPTVLVAGALAVDYSCDFAPSIANITSPQLQTSNLARITQSLGGVAHNVAKAMHYLGTNVKLLSVVGNDLDGRSAIDQLEHEDMRTDGIEECSDESARTARYVAINDSKKDLVVAMADMDLINTHGEQYFKEVWAPELQRKEAQWFVADANWEPRILHNTFQTASDAGCYTAFEPVSVTKGSRMFKRALSSSSSPLNELKELQVFPLNTIDLMAPNAMELAAIHSTAREEGLLESQEWWKIIDELGIPSSGARSRLVNSTSEALVDQGLPQQAIQLLPFVPCIITKLGADGVLLTMMLQHGDPRLHSKEAAPYIISRNHNSADAKVAGVYMRLFPPVSKVADEQIVSVNGVGDTFLGALVAGMQQTGSGVEHLIDFAQEAAVLSLQSVESVNPELMGQELRLGEMARVERPTYQMSRR